MRSAVALLAVIAFVLPAAGAATVVTVHDALSYPQQVDNWWVGAWKGETVTVTLTWEGDAGMYLVLDEPPGSILEPEAAIGYYVECTSQHTKLGARPPLTLTHTRTGPHEVRVQVGLDAATEPVAYALMVETDGDATPVTRGDQDVWAAAAHTCRV